MMLMWVLVLTALLASDVAETTDSLGPEETQQDLEMRGLSEGPCAENWFYFPKLTSCYQFFSHKRTWSDAEAFCKQQTHYGHLATVTSSEHNTFITNMSKGKPYTWIGLNDRSQEGTFTWIDGSPSSYRHWTHNQPDNHQGNEDCAHIHRKCNRDRSVVLLEVNFRHSIDLYKPAGTQRGEPAPWVLCSAELD
ncbi:alpha-N-acetylgalactosamine-specific lectin-like [Rhinoraja longicauda]